MALSPRQRRERDARIVARAERGEHVEGIASAEGVSTRQARRILARDRQVTTTEPPTEPTAGVFTLDPLAEYTQAVETVRWAIRESRRVAESTTAAAVRLGAARTAAQLSVDLLDLLERSDLPEIARAGQTVELRLVAGAAS